MRFEFCTSNRYARAVHFPGPWTAIWKVRAQRIISTLSTPFPITTSGTLDYCGCDHGPCFLDIFYKTQK